MIGWERQFGTSDRSHAFFVGYECLSPAFITFMDSRLEQQLACQSHKLKVVGANPTPATTLEPWAKTRT